MAGISDFRAALKQAARPTRFRVIVNFPAAAGTTEEIRRTAFMVESTQLPGSTLGVIEQMYQGRPYKMPGDRTFEEWTATFLNSADFKLRDAFERWHNIMNDYNDNTASGDPDTYETVVSVEQLDLQDNPIKSYTMKYSWPSNVGAVDLDMTATDTIERFPVTFQYSDIDIQNVA